MRRLALLIAAGTLWLFLAAIPALADGGPHVASVNNGVSTLTADTCAECHRAHSAKGQYLLVQKDEETLCFSCHGAVGTGSAVDVENGVQYVKSAINGLTAGDDKSSVGDSNILGYLRDGGYEKAHIDSDNGIRVTYFRSATDKSNRPKVPATTTPAAVTSAHLDLDGAGGVTAKNTIWGNGVATNASPSAEMECGSCHNIHGNGQYRILQKFNASDQLVQQQKTTVASQSVTTDRFVTAQPHDFIQGDLVTFSDSSDVAVTLTAGDTSGVYIVTSVPSATQFMVAYSANKKTSDITGTSYDLTAGTTSPTFVRRYASVVDDAPLPKAGDTRNYTILQVRGNQNQWPAAKTIAGTLSAGDNTSYLLYESNVLQARAGLGSWSTGDYGYSGGDYFHRTVPWNPAYWGSGSATCNQVYTTSLDCRSDQDAPNGRPATSTTLKQITFNEQMSAWCATCHTRYWGGSNPPPTDTSAPSSAQTAQSFTAGDSNDAVYGALSNYSIGDRVEFSNLTAGDSLPTGITAGTTYFVVATVSSPSGFKISATFDGTVLPIGATGAGAPTVVRVASVSASPWWYPRPGETDTSSYKYQHSTSSNRACIVCHVGHGSNAIMDPGSKSNAMAYPNGQTGGSVAATSGFNSRLLKVDNRGTCQMCHEPTGTVDVGTYAGASAGVSVGTAPKTVP